MINIEKWIDVRKKQIKEATDVDVKIFKIDELNSYFTVKYINEIDTECDIVKNPIYTLKVRKDVKLLEYTPLDKNYNVRVYVDENDEVYEYYFDIIDGVKIVDGVPYYNDMYLDIIYYDKDKQHLYNDGKSHLTILDKEELQEALKCNIITQNQFNKAQIECENLFNEINQGNNIFVNRGIQDYYKYYCNMKEEK